MSVLAVDEVMLCEPRLLVPGMQPLGPVKVSDSSGIPKPTVCIIQSRGLRCLAGSTASLNLSPSMTQGVVRQHGVTTAVTTNPIINSFSGADLLWTHPASDWTFAMTRYTGDTDSSESGTNAPFLFDVETGRFAVYYNYSYTGIWSAFDGVDRPLTGCTLEQEDSNTAIGFAFDSAAQQIRFASKPLDGGACISGSVTGYSAKMAIGGSTRIFDRFAPAAAYTTSRRIGLYALFIWDKALSVSQLSAWASDPYQNVSPA